jgi:hypothetical protein
MGYEVLDSGSGRPTDPRRGPSSAPLDVVDLDDLPPEGGPGAGGGRYDGPPLGAFARLSRSVAETPPPARRLLGGALAAVLVGAMVGGVAVRGYDDRQAAAADRARLSAVASVKTVGPAPGATQDEVQLRALARVSNLGPLPIRVVTGQSLPSDPTIDVLESSPEVAPGDEADLSITATVRCRSLLLDLDIVVPVLTADGRRHGLPLLGLGDAGATDALCQRSYDPVQVQLSGSLDRPVLEITNDGPRDLDFTITADEMSQEGPERSPLVTLTTDPSTPVSVRARGSRSVSLVLTARRCVRDLSRLPDGIYLLVEGRLPADNAVVATNGANLSALTGAAVARACAD